MASVPYRDLEMQVMPLLVLQLEALELENFSDVAETFDTHPTKLFFHQTTASTAGLGDSTFAPAPTAAPTAPNPINTDAVGGQGSEIDPTEEDGSGERSPSPVASTSPEGSTSPSGSLTDGEETDDQAPAPSPAPVPAAVAAEEACQATCAWVEIVARSVPA